MGGRVGVAHRRAAGSETSGAQHPVALGQFGSRRVQLPAQALEKIQLQFVQLLQSDAADGSIERVGAVQVVVVLLGEDQGNEEQLVHRYLRRTPRPRAQLCCSA